LLSTSRLEKEGYLDPEPIQRVWKEHQCGFGDRSFALWSVLMFEAWMNDTPCERQALPRAPL
jgi:asparagine synthase (glutamine-hydrolysing)